MQLKRSAVAAGKIRRDAITTAKVKDGTLLAQDFEAGALPAGPTGPAGPKGLAGADGARGPKGDTGAQGAPGESATKLFAAIRADGSLVHGKGVTASSSQGAGQFEVTFDRPLDGCVTAGSPYVDGTYGFNVANHMSITRLPYLPNELHISTYNSALGKFFSVDFSLIVVC